MTGADRPVVHLVRHFLAGLFDFGVLSETGVASFKRWLLGVATVFVCMGLLLVRIYLERYVSLDAAETAAAYERAVLADHTFLIAIPMWIVAVVTVLIGHALFPDETDFRVLMALPLTRRVIVLARLAALVLFSGGFALVTHVALAPLFLLTSLSAWLDQAFLTFAGAYLVASLMASAFAVLAIIALHGLILVALPRATVLTASATLRSVLLCGLVLSVPAILRLPGWGADVVSGAAWLAFVPPAWFLGVERWLAGDVGTHFTGLAAIGVTSLVVAGAVAAVSYALVYRHFDRIVLHGGQTSAPSARLASVRRASPDLRRPAFVAVRTFIGITLRRSVLHQGMLVVLGAACVGLASNSLIGADLPTWWRSGREPARHVVVAVTWAPFVLILGATLAVRATLVVPIEQRANWIFRMTEDAQARADQLQAAASTLRRFGVGLPVLLLLPVQWLVLGPGAMAVALVEGILGSLVVELMMWHWRVIPFTSSYIPGKGFLPQTLLKGSMIFLVFTVLGVALATLTRMGLTLAIVLDGVLIGVVLVLSRQRRAAAPTTPLEFEDPPPTDVQALGLFAD
jgi:hypothetical protein